MKRREFITLLGSAAAVWPIAARAQQSERVRRVGVLMSAAANDREAPARIASFLGGLQQLGWIEGRNIRIDIRWAAGDLDFNSKKYAAELVALAPDVLLATADSGGIASRNAQCADRVRARCRPRRRRFRR